MTTPSKQDLEDMLTGATFLGSGGGGPYAMGQLVIEKLLSSNKPLEIVDADALPDDAMAVVAAGVGSPGAAGGFDPGVIGVAITELEKTLNVTFEYLLAAEIGAGNTFMPLYAAADLGRKALNLAGATRAVPDVTMSTFAAHDVPVKHMLIANHDHQVGVKVETAKGASAPLRAVVSDPAFGQVAGVAIWPMTGAEVKAASVPGTLDLARRLGATIRQGIADGDPVAPVLDLTKGRILARGPLKGVETQTAGGYDRGQATVAIDSTTDLIVLNKNENLIAWSTGQDRPLAIAPDLISYMLPDGTVFSNVEIGDYLDKEIIVIASPSGPQMRMGGIVEAFREVLTAINYPGPATPLSDLAGKD